MASYLIPRFETMRGTVCILNSSSTSRIYVDESARVRPALHWHIVYEEEPSLAIEHDDFTIHSGDRRACSNW